MRIGTKGVRTVRGAVAALCLPRRSFAKAGERRRDEGKFDSSTVVCVFSAKGAVFNHSLGQRPRETVNENPLALTARFIAALSRAFSARSLGNMKSWGAAPGCHESALSALDTSAVIRLRSATARQVDRRYSSCETASDSRAAAFSLLEVVLALGVAAFCLIAVLGLLPVGVQTNRNANSQTAVSNIIATVVSDLRTTPAAATTSPEFAITFDAEKTLFFDASGQASPSLSADSRYRLNVTWNSAPTGLHYAVLKATWPAEVDPATTPPGGSVEIFAAFDRN
jgi:uncharacterized protein (TIGR02598 family)